MDRSLKFFTDIVIPPKNRDPKTGAPTTTHTVQTNTSVYDPKDPLGQPIRVEQNTINYTVVQSLQADGTFVNYLGNSKTNNYDAFVNNAENESDLSESDLIKWSQKIPSIALKPSHLTYLKDFRTYPTNRLMVLRRFEGPVGHDLFKMKSKPKRTMATYYSLEEPPVNITFNEKWKQFDGSFMDVLQNVIGIKFDTIPGIKNVVAAASGSNLAQELMHRIGQKLGFISEGGMPYGDPNIIYDAAIRDVSGEDVNSGLDSVIDVTFESTYSFKEINGVDARFAMLDIIGTAIDMGTSPERFYITGKSSGILRKLMSDMANGNVGGLFNDILSSIKDIVTELITKVTETAKTVADAAKEGGTDAALQAILGQLEGFASDILKQRYSRYKWQLRGAVGALSGVHTAPWHVTIGNPKTPWFSCGNMVVESVELVPGGEMTYNDMFSELTVKIKLRSGRAMGSRDLTSLFNMGKGRIYDTPDKIQKLKVADGTNITVAGSPTSVDGKNLTQDQTAGIPVPVDTDKENELENTTQFGMNNTDIDNNLNPKTV